MAVFTSTLPDSLLIQLNERAKALAIPKNKLIETALSLYFEHLEKIEYVKSYKKLSDDTDTLLIAEEGMADYFKQLED
jgi:hypothetical protein